MMRVKHIDRKKLKTIFLILLLTITGCSLNSNRLAQTSTENATAVTQVKAALIQEPDVDAAAIRLSIVNGQLLIEGFVESEMESLLVVEIANRTIDGMDLLNKLEIR